MKKIESKIFVAAMGIVSLGMTCSCSSDLADQNPNIAEMQELKIQTVNVEDQQTRAAVTNTYLPTNSQYGLFVKEANGEYALCNKEMYSSTSSTGLYITDQTYYVGAYYPYSVSQESETVKVYPGDVDYMSTDGSDAYRCNEEKTSVNIFLRHALARVKFVFSTSDDVSYTASCDGISGIYVDGTMSAYSSSTKPGELGTYRGIEFETTISKSKSASVEKLFLPQDFGSTDPFSMEVTINGKPVSLGQLLYGVTDSGAWKSGYFYTYTITIKNGDLTVTGSTIEGWGTATEMGSLSAKRDVHYEFVDLGLSVNWATMNVGAYKPQESGNYFAWGEVNPKKSYSWETYKWGTQSAITKYCAADTLNLLPEDDAAYVNWGDSCRMPTAVECEDLIYECSWKWVSNYEHTGVSGYVVTGKTGNSIFIPAAGYCTSSSVSGYKEFGYYWSSSVNSRSNSKATYIYFDSGDENSVSFSRCYGRTIRPVREKENK